MRLLDEKALRMAMADFSHEENSTVGLIAGRTHPERRVCGPVESRLARAHSRAGSPELDGVQAGR
jgi:hypothetical protein